MVHSLYDFKAFISQINSYTDRCIVIDIHSHIMLVGIN